jgi:recombination associated protein RdgC
MKEEKPGSVRKDMVDLIREKEFLGREFLTWLWFRSDISGGVVTDLDGVDIAVSFERFIMLESGEGESGESVTCRGLQASLSEGMAALASGKKVSKAHMRLGTGDYEWKLTITGSTFDISSLRVPRTVQAGYDEEELSREGRVLERGFMISSAIDTLDRLFRTFLSKRLSDDEWQEEKQSLSQWITGRTGG